ncbi:hypothetical protein QMO56_18780 [Roseomonas sp. E05]|nr:hypothetical protein [Roseomonas sp. E05]MDJ0390159.1 hypothetical protein [Roseomonas sp. E05]
MDAPAFPPAMAVAGFGAAAPHRQRHLIRDADILPGAAQGGPAPIGA